MLPFIINGKMLLLCIWILNPKFLIFSDATSNNFDFDSEELHCTLIDLMIYNFLESPKIMGL
jgi:hypothetical protein